MVLTIVIYHPCLLVGEHLNMEGEDGAVGADLPQEETFYQRDNWSTSLPSAEVAG